ncbi:hypothetical protein A1F94_006894 [Pyrenophora tritici-repentis]|uniref:Uncharacterized protein n=1 Tax=Pyrenophora tritici-repentis TaxID=45151 RepID=A0A834RSV5_9PLEO|nr:hypothetical protein PtrM4_116510 [Pyrenophora tritici-repentis]KAG9382973.1 hypothetical protein A1F94_006894 [Pyrenophora tritici-repentis]KAI1525516.1 hypothetical protein PtrSN001C_010599 [Pyrenophora tritici-repentis]
MTKVLSHLKYQQNQPPFEARQVLECVRIEDPYNAHPDVQVAVTKVKYQVHGTPASCFFYWNQSQESEEKLRRATGTAHDENAESCQYDKQRLQLATKPTDKLNDDTTKEFAALTHFKNGEFTHAPHILGFAVDNTAEEADDTEAMLGGYVVFMLMNKLPGEQITWAKCWSKEEKTREEIRCAFKVALMDVWSVGAWPSDHGMRKVMWDEQEHKWYVFLLYCQFFY